MFTIAPHLFVRKNAARGIVGIHDGNEFGLWRGQPLQFIQVKPPVVSPGELRFLHAASRVFCQSPYLPIAGRNDDDFISRLPAACCKPSSWPAPLPLLQARSPPMHWDTARQCAREAAPCHLLPDSRAAIPAAGADLRPASRSLTLAHFTELSARLISTVRSHCD